MTRRLNIILLCLLIPFLMMQAQSFSSLRASDEISTGRLPNGIEYYIVVNDAEKGFADFAVARKSAFNDVEDRAALDSLPHFGSRVPFHFLSGRGAGYGRSGYIGGDAHSTVFSFPDVPTYDQSVADSTILMMMDIVARSRQPQAIIISGDINPGKIKERMDLLSMTVPVLYDLAAGLGYEWRPKDSLMVRGTLNRTSDVASISAIYSAERLPRDRMNTIQPLMARAYATILGEIVSHRLEDSFRRDGIPLAGTSFVYDDSSASPGDERYRFTVYASYSRLNDATRLFSSVLSSIDRFGVSLTEFSDAKEKLIAESNREEGEARVSNSEYVDRCVAAYLYGASLAPTATIGKILSGKSLNKEMELALFNNYASALLDSENNLYLRFDTPDTGYGKYVLAHTFSDAWSETALADSTTYRKSYSDTLRLFSRKTKVKFRSESPEPVSGGKMWTFSNGVKVLYKKTSVRGEFRYCLMLRGGMAAVDSLHSGEGAFVGDMLSLSDVAGLDGRSFRKVLSANGISMDGKVGVSDMRIEGTAPKAKLPLLLRSLLSVADNRVPNKADFDYYKLGESLRVDMESLSPRDVNSLMDSIMRPNYYYTDRKFMSNLHDDLPRKAEKYFDTQFSKVNDGLLVLVGDLDEETLKKELTKTLGGFRTQKRFAQRPRIVSQLATGSVTYTVESGAGLVGGGEIGVNVGFSAAVPYNIENYMTFKVAVQLIRKELVKALADAGASLSVTEKIEVFPTERLSVFINCKPCIESGLPLSVSAAEPLGILAAIRPVLSSIENIEIPDNELNAYKEVVLNEYAEDLRNPEILVDRVLTRYSDGKDLVTGYQAAVKSVKADDVRRILSQLKSGADVEYVII